MFMLQHASLDRNGTEWLPETLSSSHQKYCFFTFQLPLLSIVAGAGEDQSIPFTQTFVISFSKEWC
jgi:hypothetical protein